jgi:hypothetical protein
MLTALAVLAVGFMSASLAAKEAEIDVVVDFTPEGRELRHPTVTDPAYYLPLPSDFLELGSPIAGERTPLRFDVLHYVALQLASQGYREMNPRAHVNADGELTFADGFVVRVPRQPGGPNAPLFDAAGIPLTLAMLKAPSGPYSAPAAHAQRKTASSAIPAITRILATVDPVHGPMLDGMPTMILTIHYGYISPQFDEVPGAGHVFFNQNQMLGLVAGSTLDHIGSDFDASDIEQKTEVERYFVMITAYDFGAYVRGRKKVMLWQAKMSAAFHGLGSFGEVMPALVAAGAPFFGRETVHPELVTQPVPPEGHVEVGTPTVKEGESGQPPAKTGTAHPP